MQPTTLQRQAEAGGRGWRHLGRFLRRRRFVVDRPFQLGLVGHLLAVQLLFLLLVTAGLFAPLLDEITGQQPDQLSEASVALLFLHQRFWIVVGGGFVVTALLAVRLSHRIAGPLVRFRRHLATLAEGTAPPPLLTRRGDYLRAEVALLNQAASQLRGRGAAAQRCHARLMQGLAQLAAAGSDLDYATQRRLQEAIAAAIELQQALPFCGETAPAVPAAPPVAVPPPIAAVVEA